MTSFGTVKRLVEGWHPRKCKTEHEYELALHRYLVSKLPKVTVIRQYGMGVTKADICVDARVFVELKKDLCTASRLQRLLGQLHMYRRHGVKKVVVVLAGRTEERMVKEVQHVLRESWDDFLDEREGAVLVIPVRRRRPVQVDPAILRESVALFAEAMSKLNNRTSGGDAADSGQSEQG